MVGNRKSDEVKMKSISGSAVIAASRPASATSEFHLVFDLGRLSKMLGYLLMTFMKPSRRFTALASSSRPTSTSGMQLLAGALEPADRLRRHRLDRLAGDRLVVGDDDDALAHVGRRAVERGDRHVGLLRQGDERRLGVAVVGRQDDAVGALGDAVLDLLELPVGVLAAVELDDLDAVFLQRRHDRLVARDPEAGRQILERVADFLGFRGLDRRCRECGQAGRRDRAAA